MNYNPSQALTNLDNDKEFLKVLIGVYLKELPNYKARLENAKNNGDPKLLSDAAHNVKGASATIGFEEARSLALKLEKSSLGVVGGITPELMALYVPLIEALNDAPETLSHWVDSN